MALQSELVEMEGPGEQAFGKVDVGQYQMRGIHSLHRGHPYPRGPGQQALVNSVTESERCWVGGNRDGSHQHGVTEIDSSMP